MVIHGVATEMHKRNAAISVRFTVEEKTIIERWAQERGLDVSDFIRKGVLAYSGAKVDPPPEPVRKWLAKIVEGMGRG